jgi:hypothetical protein
MMQFCLEHSKRYFFNEIPTAIPIRFCATEHFRRQKIRISSKIFIEREGLGVKQTSSEYPE